MPFVLTVPVAVINTIPDPGPFKMLLENSGFVYKASLKVWIHVLYHGSHGDHTVDRL